MKTVCPFCGAYRYDSQQMSGIFRLYSYKVYYTKNRRGVQFPRPEKKKKAPGFPGCFARAIPCRLPAKPEQAGQAHRSAPRKIPHKSPALPDFYTSARAAAARPPLPCRGEGGIVFGFSGTENVSRGDSVPPGITQPSHTSSCSPLRGRASSILMPSFADRPPYSTPYIASVIGMETPCCCARW